MENINSTYKTATNRRVGTKRFFEHTIESHFSRRPGKEDLSNFTFHEKFIRSQRPRSRAAGVTVVGCRRLLSTAKSFVLPFPSQIVGIPMTQPRGYGILNEENHRGTRKKRCYVWLFVVEKMGDTLSLWHYPSLKNTWCHEYYLSSRFYMLNGEEGSCRKISLEIYFLNYKQFHLTLEIISINWIEINESFFLFYSYFSF